MAGDYDDHGGYQHNVATNEFYGGAIRRAGRVTLVVKPIDNLQSRTVVEYGTTKGHPTINTIYSYYPCGTPGLVTSAACLYSPALDTVIGFPGAWDAYLAAHPGANPGGIPGALTRQQQLGIWGVDSLQPNSFLQENWSATNTTTYDLTDNVQLKNIVGVYTNGTGLAYGGGLLHYGPVGDVSRLAGSVFTQVRLPTPTPWGEMSVRADSYAQSAEYFSNLNDTLTPGTRLPGYSLLNLRYDWREVFGSGLTVSAFAKNALDRGYYTGGESFGVDFGLNDAAPAEPRTYGAELSYRF